MGPWLLLVVLVAATNLFAFIAVRGRWGRIVLALAIAALLGTAGGEWVSDSIGIDPVRIGDFALVGACVGAQLAMIGTTLLAAVLPTGGSEEVE
jgi:hypothetical protein